MSLQADQEYGETLLTSSIASASGDASVFPAPGAGKRVVVTAFMIVCTAAGTVQFQTVAGVNLSGAMAPGAGGVLALNGDRDSPVLALAANQGLDVNSSAAIAGFVTFFIEQVGT